MVFIHSLEIEFFKHKSMGIFTSINSVFLIMPNCMLINA